MSDDVNRQTLHLEMPFSLDAWEPVPDPSPVEDGAPETARVVMRKTYKGDSLNAASTGHALTTQGARGASYVAQERITGSLNGREGSFILEHGATMGEGHETTMHAEIVPGSGTGALAGIGGRGRIEHELLTLDVELP